MEVYQRMPNIKTLNRNGQITIPKHILRELNFKEGYFVSVYKENQIIVIDQQVNDTFNQCVFRNGKVSIPAELRHILKINTNTPLQLDVSPEKQKIFIKRMVN